MKIQMMSHHAHLHCQILLNNIPAHFDTQCSLCGGVCQYDASKLADETKVPSCEYMWIAEELDTLTYRSTNQQSLLQSSYLIMVTI